MFYGSKLESVKLPSDVTAIEDFAFSGCSDLYYVSIPSSVTSIGKWAFWITSIGALLCYIAGWIVPLFTRDQGDGIEYREDPHCERRP